ncbi:hypothetical protein K439DRAFT_280587 [Ramaria rubella]|nr:hypothetical protein K439DRAFT_280587 [Ramaria rubella]
MELCTTMTFRTSLINKLEQQNNLIMNEKQGGTSDASINTLILYERFKISHQTVLCVVNEVMIMDSWPNLKYPRYVYGDACS